VQEREGWSTPQLAEWCQTEDLGFATQAHVVRILNWHRTVGELQAANVIPAGIAPSQRAFGVLIAAWQALVDAGGYNALPPGFGWHYFAFFRLACM
jgi:hypothetical protein